MAPSLFVDTSAWLAFLSARDARHADADRLFRAALGRKLRLLTTNLVLAELHRLLLYRAGSAPAAAALDRIGASPAVTTVYTDDAAYREARAWLARLDDQVISLTDATTFAVMKAHRCKLALSFDRDFAVAGFQLWADR